MNITTKFKEPSNHELIIPIVSDKNTIFASELRT